MRRLLRQQVNKMFIINCKNYNEISGEKINKLASIAEKISKEDFDATKLLVISAVGTREYYKKLGYSLDGPYMSKQLR